MSQEMNVLEPVKALRFEKHAENPILRPNPENDWESLVVCNPGVWYENGRFYMLYRAAGNDEEHIIRFGLAESEDGIHFTRSSDQPVFSPSSDGPDMGGVEDARIVKFEDYYYVTYAYRPFPPGQYWKFEHDVIKLPTSTESTPKVYKKMWQIQVWQFLKTCVTLNV